MQKTFCMSEQNALFAPRQLQQKGACSRESELTESCLLNWFWPTDMSSCEAFTFPFISFTPGSLAFNLPDWAGGTSFRLAISTGVHELSVKKWLFNNVAFTAEAQGPVAHYRAITSEILVWTSGGKLMCCFDERFSLWGLQRELNRGDKINCKWSW